MPIPDFQALFLPLLRFASDGLEHSVRDAVEQLGQEIQLSTDERKTLLSSGMPVFDNRINWACTYLKKAGLLESTRRAHFKITTTGLELLSQSPTSVNVKTLDQYEAFQKFHKGAGGQATAIVGGSNNSGGNGDADNVTPQEALEKEYRELRSGLIDELLNQISRCSPSFFEKLVVELLVKMGYGGSMEDAGRAVGRTGDEGIDGIIKGDRLGLDEIYIQAKRWQGNVGSPEIQKFVGALSGQKATRGVFITTSSFTPAAVDYINKVSNKVVLIDGVTLAGLMIDYNLGVSRVALYEVKRVDSDYFEE